jgi:hypothetical protein
MKFLTQEFADLHDDPAAIVQSDHAEMFIVLQRRRPPPCPLPLI